ncbi:MAG: hypothetical protein M3R05_07190 [Chloroflexota bacterium]|nr:hypothetical protein [Chloroflexota bacterium]
MRFERIGRPIAAAIAVLAIGGAGIAAAASPAPSTAAPAAADTGTLTQGDQTTPDVAGAAEPAESGAEAAGVEADGPGGHADAAGTVDYQFDGEQ